MVDYRELREQLAERQKAIQSRFEVIDLEREALVAELSALEGVDVALAKLLNQADLVGKHSAPTFGGVSLPPVPLPVRGGGVRQAFPDETKVKVFKLLAEGRTQLETAKLAGVGMSTVAGWLWRSKTEPTLRRLREQGEADAAKPAAKEPKQTAERAAPFRSKDVVVKDAHIESVKAASIATRAHVEGRQQSLAAGETASCGFCTIRVLDGKRSLFSDPGCPNPKHGIGLGHESQGATVRSTKIEAIN